MVDLCFQLVMSVVTDQGIIWILRLVMFFCSEVLWLLFWHSESEFFNDNNV